MKELMKIEEEGLLEHGMQVVAYAQGSGVILTYNDFDKRWLMLDNNYKNSPPLDTRTLVDLYRSVHFVVRYKDELLLAKRLLKEE